MVGKDVEITVAEEAESTFASPDGFWNGPSADELAARQGVSPVSSIEQLRGDAELVDALDGFDEAVHHWRHEPWQTGDR